MQKYMYRFIYSILALASIFMPGPIVPMISLVIAIGILVYKIKLAKESKEGFDMLKVDIIMIIIVLVIDIGFVALRISIENSYNRSNYSQTSKEQMTSSEFAEAVIWQYQVKNTSLFLNGENNTKAIRSGLEQYLKNDLGLDDVTIKGKNVICYFENEKIIFTVDDNEISFNIK